MKRKLLVSIAIIIGCSSISISALASSIQAPEIKECYIRIEPIPEAVEEVIVESTVSGNEIKEANENLVPEDTGSITKEDKELLAKIAKAEAGNQDLKGRALVVRVVLNRVEDLHFPDSIREVIYQKDQFSPVKEGIFENTIPDEESWTAVEMILKEDWDESQGALYFESESESTWHRNNLDHLFDYGDHSFYTGRKEEEW